MEILATRIGRISMITDQSDFLEALDKVKAASREQRIGELEVRLGTARLEGDMSGVLELEGALARTRASAESRVTIDVSYPQPLDEAAYYGLAGSIVKKIEPHSEADPVALLLNFLTAYGSVIGDTSYFTVGTERHPAKLFVALVGESSKSRKGSSWGPIRSIFSFADLGWLENRVQSGLSTGEGLIWHVRDEIHKRTPNKNTGLLEDTLIDEGVLDKRLLIQEGELASVLKVLSREGNTVSPVIRNAWDNGNLQLLTKNSPARASNAHISIIAHITLQELVKGLAQTETENGFGNRFLWLCVRRSKSLPFGGNFDLIDFNSIADKVKASIEFARSCGRVAWADDTRPLWQAVYSELSEGKPGLIGSLTGRAEAQVTRLALIYALLDSSREVGPQHLKAALAVWSYAEGSVRFIFQGKAIDLLANRILDALAANPGGLTRTDINNRLGRHRSKVEIGSALETLRGLDLAICETLTTGGRPVEIWRSVNNGAK